MVSMLTAAVALLTACANGDPPPQSRHDAKAPPEVLLPSAPLSPTPLPPPPPPEALIMPAPAMKEFVGGPPTAAPMSVAPPATGTMSRSRLLPPSYQPQWQAQPDTAKYESYTENPWQRVAEQPVSTFSASVDTGSYANVRRFINRGQLPPKDAVRVEELVNYFGFDDAGPAPDAKDPFKVRTQVMASPWHLDRGLIRITVKGKDVAKSTLPPANLVFLVDVSGSMGPQDRLPLVQSGLKLLTAQLRPQDRVSLVTYASGSQVVLPPTPGDQKERINQAIDQLRAGGGTYGEGGIRLAYAQAREALIKDGINRVLLATDGDLNIGVTDPLILKALVEEQRKLGISLTTLGVGDSNYNEALMKRLADVGNGSYHYLDSLQEAHKVLVNEMTSTLAIIAQDLKLQLEFNPAVVQEYRLIGYELHALKREDFNNDKVDAGDIGAGHQVTALYEFIPRGAKGTVDPLRYGTQGDEAPDSGKGGHGGKGGGGSPGSKSAAGQATSGQAKSNELAWVKLRYKQPGETQSRLTELPVARPATLPSVAGLDADTRFAVAVAAWGQWLRGSSLIGDYGPAQFVQLARDSRGDDRYGHRAEFARLAELSATLKQ
ncbi:vWA domain-containing protein [Roseateles terrae]|uniref:Ca-activated chloride channel family protein n=1 Tax=Roseateles terrae TaxID=431060 RepID=A0ABR6GLE2_9BURK|nr:VWA domain-containing protein [Roseateles terrae]MBB3192923.1 Ca-activated chloride channel family protein [Roseateles terrae]